MEEKERNKVFSFIENNIITIIIILSSLINIKLAYEVYATSWGGWMPIAGATSYEYNLHHALFLEHTIIAIFTLIIGFVLLFKNIIWTKISAIIIQGVNLVHLYWIYTHRYYSYQGSSALFYDNDLLFWIQILMILSFIIIISITAIFISDKLKSKLSIPWFVTGLGILILAIFISFFDVIGPFRWPRPPVEQIHSSIQFIVGSYFLIFSLKWHSLLPKRWHISMLLLMISSMMAFFHYGYMEAKMHLGYAETRDIYYYKAGNYWILLAGILLIIATLYMYKSRPRKPHLMKISKNTDLPNQNE